MPFGGISTSTSRFGGGASRKTSLNRRTAYLKYESNPEVSLKKYIDRDLVVLTI